MSDIIAKDSEILKMGVSYTDKGKDIKYGRATVVVILNPFTGQYCLAVKPYYRNKFDEWVELYSYEDDARYNHYMSIIADCEFSGKPIPPEIEDFVKGLIAKKNYARKQANAFVEEKTGEKGIETGYAMNKWRDDIIAGPDARKLLDDYLKSIKG